MTTISAILLRHLQPIVGMPLSIARRASSMRGFHFGAVRPIDRGTAGEYSLHIQCPWRIEGPNGILTGSSDLWRPLSSDVDWNTWTYERGNLQDALLREWLGGYDEGTRSLINPDERLVVEAVKADDYGGATIALSGGFRLVLFPDGSDDENWRLFQCQTDAAHLVVEGGRIIESCAAVV